MNGIRRGLKYLLFLVLIVFICGMLLNIPEVYNTLDEVIISKISRILFYKKAVSIYGGNERLAIIEDSFTNIKTWLLGAGMGSSLWIEEGAHGYSHYGLSSMGSFLVQMGIWFLFFQIIIYTGMCCKFVSGYMKNKRNSRLVFFVSLLFIVGLSLYSAIFTSYTSSYWIFMTYYAFGEINRKIQEKKNGERDIIYQP